MRPLNRPPLRDLLAETASSLFHRYVEIEQSILRDVLPHCTPPGYTDHGLKHAQNVQENLRDLLPNQLSEPLSGFELFALLLATMLHDVGMILSRCGDEQLPQIRVNHSERSRDFVNERRGDLGLTQHEAFIIGALCHAHGMPTLDYLQGQPFSLSGSPVRVPLLSALLRLADYLDLTAERAPSILATSRVISPASQQHWDLHRSISSVDIVSDPCWHIRIVAVPPTRSIESRLYDLRNSIQAELDAISPVLRAAGIFFKRIDLDLNNTLLSASTRARKNPFLRLAPFGPREADLFAGRDEEVNQLVELLTGRPLVVLMGESGVGKTSLVEAGVIPRLRGYGFDVVRFSFQNDPMGSLVAALDRTAGQAQPEEAARGRATDSTRCDLLQVIRQVVGAGRRRRSRLLIIGDHLEQMFTVTMSRDAKIRFVGQMARALGNRDGRFTFLFCIRQDYLADLYDLSRDLPELYERANTFKLQRLSKHNGIQVLERASRYARLKLPPKMIERIANDLAQEGEGLVYPPFLQIVGYSLYAAASRGSTPDNGFLPEGLYDRLGRAETIGNRYLDGLLDDFSRDDRLHVGEILAAMVTEYHTKRRVTREFLQDRVANCHNLDQLLAKLVQDRIVRRSLGEYELIHDFLARRVLQLIDKNMFVSAPVRLALDYINSNFTDPELSSVGVARAAGVSAIHLAALFRDQLDASINQRLNSTRITAAKRELARTRDSVSTIARHVGFRSLASFSRKFSKIEGISPLSYRAGIPLTQRARVETAAQTPAAQTSRRFLSGGAAPDGSDGAGSTT
jgi:AraC-like DNA-binding protein